VKIGNPEKIGRLVAWLVRVIGSTLRIQVIDHARVTDPTFKQPMIWTFWHNRIFVIPLLRIRHARHRSGAVLTSASRDGAIVAGAMKSFDLNPVRGSSSRRGASALLKLTGILERGEDVAVAPDGPRGPRYKVGAGVIFLARKTGAPILPIRVEYAHAIKLKSWDQFMIPLPFTIARIICEPLIFIPPESEAEPAERQLEQALGAAQDHVASLEPPHNYPNL
jgi:lysophospholipid acyltransferase (LPLAT)-like uncharacterized protein